MVGLEHGDGAVVEVDFDPDLVPGMRRNTRGRSCPQRLIERGLYGAQVPVFGQVADPLADRGLGDGIGPVRREASDPNSPTGLWEPFRTTRRRTVRRMEATSSGGQVSSVTIRAISPADIDIACEVIGMAFADNPNTLAIARGDPARAERIMRAGVRVGKLGRPGSTAIVAEWDGAIVGVLNAAAWPACQRSVGERLRTAPAMIRAIGSALPRAFAMLSVWEKHDPKQAHWHIGPIAVRPGLQGQGIGSTMLASFLETVDAAGSAAYLETDVDRNVPLYERFGFKIIGRADINGVDNRFLWRDAVQSQAK